MDAVATMGGLLPAEAWGRDAVHVAVFSAFSSERLFPGQDVAIINEEGGKDMRVGTSGGLSIGVVDPFLKATVMPGERFWVYLYPRTITALSHRWSHPAFEETKTIYATPALKAESEAWLRQFCSDGDPGYETAMAGAARFLKGGGGGGYDDEYLHFNDTDAHGEIPPEFWDHASVVLGVPLPDGDKPTYFSCSC